MSFRKTFSMSLLTVSMCVTPFIAHGANLIISNYTNQDSTSIINNGSCSNVFGDSGITKAHTTNVVPESLVKLACMADPVNCKADVYMTPNCTGPKIAVVTFNVATGISSVVMTYPGYKISAAGFNINLTY